VYQRATAYNRNPDKVASAYARATMELAEEIGKARLRLPSVTVGAEARDLGLQLIQKLGVDSNRAEMTLFEAARAHAAADEREQVELVDVKAVALISLRQRQSPGLAQFFREQAEEDEKMRAVFETSS